jgi:hypothetical protein
MVPEFNAATLCSAAFVWAVSRLATIRLRQSRPHGKSPAEAPSHDTQPDESLAKGGDW